MVYFDQFRLLIYFNIVVRILKKTQDLYIRRATGRFTPDPEKHLAQV